MNQPTETPKKGAELELVIEELAFGGEGIARLNDFVIFVEGGLPGQRLKGRIIKKRKKYANARILEILQQSPVYTKPKCKHFGQCGGCRLQHLTYQTQLESKQKQIVDILHRIGRIDDFRTEPIIPSPDQYFYRNKMDFSFSRFRWLDATEIASNMKLNKEGLFLGLHAKNFYEKVIDIQSCYLQDEKTNDILSAVRSFARSYPSKQAYSTSDHSGFWRFLVIRQSKFRKDFMVNLVTREYDKDIAQQFKAMMQKTFPYITSLLFSTTMSKSSVSFSEEDYLLAGEKTIVECLDGLEFEISANSFFQTNSKQAKNLYDTVVDYAELSGNETVYDLYCGAGTISLYLSPHAKKVIGFESVADAIRDAERNQTRNNISNCRFVEMDLKNLKHTYAQMTKNYGRPHVTIIDPPRAGMHPDTLETVLELNPDRIVYVSCNPASLARDVAIICRGKYHLQKIKPVDMFPHTAHVEVVAQLIRT
jgi:23S rRNA (uracil1939-C5)-methyltransferase